MQLLGELDDENRVLARQADEHHQADLHEDVDRRCSVRAARRRTEQSTHNGTTRITASGNVQLSYRAASARKTHTTASAEHDQRGVALADLHEHQLGPLRFHRARQRLVGELVHPAITVAGADARQQAAGDRRRGVEVVALHEDRAVDLAHVDQRAERHHLPRSCCAPAAG